MKSCPKCRVVKDVSAYNKDSSRKDGLQSWCRECTSTYNRKRYEEKGEQIRAQVNARAKSLGKDLYIKFQRSYAQEYYQKNKERINKRNAEYAKNNPEVRRGIKARYRAQLVKGMSKLDRKKSTLHRKNIKDDPCFYCKDITPEMHDDHYYPLSKGGTDHWFNIVRSCSLCNWKKNNRLVSQSI